MSIGNTALDEALDLNPDASGHLATGWTYYEVSVRRQLRKLILRKNVRRVDPTGVNSNSARGEKNLRKHEAP